MAQDRALEIEELFKLTDRKGSELVLAMTHEEAVTFHVAQMVRSYRDLPLILYHFQVKERDEPRPRAGVLRTREFVMKDSYTFDRDQAGLEERYALHVGAYDRIMERTGLRFYRVEADVGMMGGLGAHEYMAPCAAGEDEVVLGPGLRRQRRGGARSARACDEDGASDYTLGRRAAQDRAGDRDRQHLQARHPLLRAARRHATSTSTATSSPIWMGSYGIGPARIVAAAVEQFADEHGISWPRALAPFAVHLVALGKPGTPERDAAERVYETLSEGGVEVALRRPRSRPGREVRRRRAARLPAAADRRAPLAGVGRDRGPGAPRPRPSAPGLPLDGEPEGLLGAVDELWQTSPDRRSGRRAESAGPRRALTRRGPPADPAPAGRPRPLRAAAAADAGRAAAAPVDDPQRDRLRPRSR